MAAGYAAYATQVCDALQTIIETTGVTVDPAVEFVSCGSGLHDHFVPKTSLQKHLVGVVKRKCHGEWRPRPIHDAVFFYGRRRTEEDAVNCQDLLIARTVNGAVGSRGPGGTPGIHHDGSFVLQSLFEPETSQHEKQKESSSRTNGDGLIAAMRRAATSAGTFYRQVHAWQRIPRAFATMKDRERKLVSPLSLRRWLNAELNRPGVLPSGEAFDDELVDYISGLLEHPDFCQPDLLVSELHEFLGSNVSNIVLALWKFMVVEIGLQTVFQKTENSVGNMTIQVKPSSVRSHDSTIMAGVLKSRQAHFSDANAEHKYKRRRASYKGKIGTKTGLDAYRDMIRKHMVGLSLEMNRELVLDGGFQDEEDRSRSVSILQQSHPDAVNWFHFTDALEVRNRGRPQSQDQSSSRKRQSGLRSREKSNFGAEDNVGCNGLASPDSRSGRRSSERSRRRSRCRSRSPRSRDYQDAKRRHSSRRKRHDRSDYFHDRHRKYHH